MRRQRGLVGLMGLAALVGLGIVAKPAVAAVTTEQSASILVFPKVIADGTRDTIIQITNTSNNMRHAHCFYVDGALENPALPPSAFNPPRWQEIDFDIWLTKQQPTHWVVSRGRQDYPLDQSCRNTVCQSWTTGGPTAAGNPADCCDAGFDPGRVPPVQPGFTGELKCIEVDAGGFPVPGNSMKGEATLEDIATADVSKYNAIGLQGFDTNNMDLTLCLGGGVTDLCPTGAEYQACPATWLLDHPARGVPDPVVQQQPYCEEDPANCSSSISTNVTFVPCTEPFETQNPPTITLQFSVTNEYEETFSASTSFACWASFNLGDPDPVNFGINDIFNTGTIGGEILQTRVRTAAGGFCQFSPTTHCSTDGDCGGSPCVVPHGVMAVIEETHTATIGGTTVTARAAQNAHATFQDQPLPDIVTIPEGQGGLVP